MSYGIELNYLLMQRTEMSSYLASDTECVAELSLSRAELSIYLSYRSSLKSPYQMLTVSGQASYYLISHNFVLLWVFGLNMQFLWCLVLK